MRSYTHLTQDERYHIYGLRKSGMSLTGIAREMRRNKSTVSRELRRNLGGRATAPNRHRRSIRGVSRRRTRTSR